MKKKRNQILKRINILFVLFLSGIFSVMAQSMKIEGKVTDSKGEALVGVTVAVKGTTIGTMTNINGVYNIDVTKPNQKTLVFSYIGFTTVEVDVTTQKSYNVVLKEDSKVLDDVVVVAYGVQKKANLTGAVSAIRMDDVKDIPVSNTASLLQGRMSGVTVSSFSSQPGKDDVEIRIRGLNTFGNNNPLVLIDGVEGNLSSISPNDIENISVLKDAASASIYGVRAAAGVVLITTKRGRIGENKLSFNSSYGVQTATVLPKFLDSWKWATLYNEQNDVKGQSASNYTPAMIDALKNGNDPDHFANTNWSDAIMRTGSIQNYHLSASGGNENSSYMLSLGHVNQDGIMIGTNSKRTNFRLNTDSKFLNLFNIGMNLAGSYQTSAEPVVSIYDIFTRVLDSRPTVPTKYSNGEYGYFDGNNNLTSPIHNPLYDVERTSSKGNDYRFDGKVFAGIELIKDLHIKTSFAAQYHRSDYSGLSPASTLYNAAGEPKNSSLGYLYEGERTDRQWINENIITYKKDFAGHNLSFLLGQSSQYNDYSYISIEGRELPHPSSQVLPNAKDIIVGRNPDQTSKGTATLSSWFGRINYAYENRYLLEANLRRDLSSRIPPKNRTGYFPSVSAGWNIAEEAFLKDNNTINGLKIRASWGQLGNQEIGFYPYEQTYSIGNANYMWGNSKMTGVALSGAANPDIKWETTTTTDIGFDAVFFNNTVTVTFDYFDKKSTDILLQLPISDIVGVSQAPYVNAAKVGNKGWELTVGYNNKLGDFLFGANLNLSQVKNKILDVSGRENWIEGNTINIAGQPIGAYYGYIADGLYTSQKEIDETPCLIGSPGIGDIRYMDISGPDGKKDGKITEHDRTVIGNPFPELTYGLNLTGGYKGFDLAIFFQGITKVDRWVVDYPQVRGGVTEVMWNRYHPTANPNGTYPRLGNETYNGLTPSSFWIKDASYCRLKNLEVGYSLPTSLISKAKLQKVRVFLSAQNLLTISNIKNYDPEKFAWDSSGRTYPNAKTFSIGLNINL